MPYDFTSIRDIEQSNSQRQKVEWWVPGAGEQRMGSYYFMRTEFKLKKMGKFCRWTMVRFVQWGECT